MYRPSFCCDCGERILRERWRAWTSGRFCPACEKRHGRGWIAPVAACCLLACAGFAAGRLMRPAPPPLLVERGSLPVPALLAKTGDAPGSGGAGHGSNAPAALPTTDGGANPGSTLAPSDELPEDPAEIVSVCGARTLKGTPCGRRVRGVGRCYQHRGRPAMLPPEKLIVRD